MKEISNSEILKRVIMHILGETYVQHWYNYDDLCWQVRTKDFQQELDIENFGNMEMLLKCLRERQEKHWLENPEEKELWQIEEITTGEN